MYVAEAVRSLVGAWDSSWLQLPAYVGTYRCCWLGQSRGLACAKPGPHAKLSAGYLWPKSEGIGLLPLPLLPPHTFPLTPNLLPARLYPATYSATPLPTFDDTIKPWLILSRFRQGLPGSSRLSTWSLSASSSTPSQPSTRRMRLKHGPLRSILWRNSQQPVQVNPSP